MTIQTATAVVASAQSAGVAACAVAAVSSASMFAASCSNMGSADKFIGKRGAGTGTERTNEEHSNTWSIDRDNQGSCGAVEVSKF